MPTNLDPKAAAEAIRGDMQQPSAENRHVEAFVTQVLDHLGMEHSINNAMIAAQALHRHDIAPHQAQEYPKHVTVKDANDKDVVHVVNSEDEERKLNEAHDGEPHGDPVDPEYPKTIKVRGTDGVMRDQVVRDLKEEREFLGTGASAVDPEASTEFKKAGLERPTEEELHRADATSKGGAQQAEGLRKANAPKR